MFQVLGVEVAEERSARKNPLDDAETRALLEEVEIVQIGRGKKLVELSASDASVDDLKGRSGKVRAPTVRVGSTLLVGFHREALEALIGA